MSGQDNEVRVREPMSKPPKHISQNSQVGAENGLSTSSIAAKAVINMQEFPCQNANGKSDLRQIVKYLARETNRLKLNYGQLKYVFKAVRDQCDVVIPGAKGRKLYELPTTDELERFYAAIEDPIHKLIFETLEMTGLRVSELVNLQVDRLDLKNNVGFVSKGKGDKDRIVIIPTSLAEKIRIYLDGRNNRFLFESNRNTKYSRRRIAQLCAKYRREAEIGKKLSAHTFRHLFCTKLAEAGVSKEKRAILAGHSSERTQEVYTHLGVGGVKNEVLAILERMKR